MVTRGRDAVETGVRGVEVSDGRDAVVTGGDWW